MKELNILQKAINQVSMTWCPETTEKLTIERGGYYNEKTPLCPDCVLVKDCPILLTGNYKNQNLTSVNAV